MAFRSLILAACAALLGAGAPAAAQQSEPPREVQALLRDVRFSCVPGPAGRLRQGAVQSADLNGDGRADYVIDFGAIDCPSGSPGYCGSGGCRIDAVVSSPDGYRARDLGVLGTRPRIVRGRGLPVVHIPSRRVTLSLRWNGRRLAILP